MTTSNVNLGGLGGQPSQNAPGNAKPNFPRGKVVVAPASENNPLFVALDGASGAWPEEIGPRHWTSKGARLPQKGDIGVLIFDGHGDAWLIGWDGPTLPSTVVTSLPLAPVDGQECYYVADAVNGIVWHLKYRVASTSTHKWEFTGGSPVTVFNAGVTAVAASGAVRDTLSFVLPFAGDYEVDFGGRLYGSSGVAGQVGMSIEWARAGVAQAILTMGTIDTWLNAQTGQGFTNVAHQMQTALLRGQSNIAGDTVRTYLNPTSAANYERIYMKVTPVRVG